MLSPPILWLRRRSTIRFRIYLAAALLLSLFYFATIFSSVTYLKDLQEERRGTLLDIVAELLSTAAEEALWRGDSDALQPIVTALLASTAVSQITIIDSRGHPFLSSRENHWDSRQVDRQSTAIQRQRMFAEFDALDVDRNAIDHRTINVGRIDIDIDREAISHAVMVAMAENSLALLLAAILTIPLVSLLVLSVTRPLQDIMVDLKRLKSGNYAQLGNDHDCIDEYAVLRSAFQDARLSITRKTVETEAANRQLAAHTDALQQQIAVTIDARKAADQANARKDIFVTNIARTMKTPLDGIMASLYLLETHTVETQTRLIDDGPGKRLIPIQDKLRGTLQTIDLARQGGHQLQALIDKLVYSLNTVEKDTTLEVRPVNLLAQLHTLFTAHATIACQKGLAFHSELPETADIWVTTDWIRVGQILNALLSNAIRFTHHGDIRVITQIATVSDNVHLTVDIADTGMGLSDQEKATILQLFLSGEPATGIGTGLTIARRIADKLGGHLYLKSTSKAEGSRFSFECAFTPSLPDTIGEDTWPNTPEPDQERKVQLLYVDRSPINQHIFQQHCHRHTGINLILADNSKDGMEKYLRGNFDGLIIDNQLHAINGHDLMTHVRENERQSGAARSFIVALSANGSTADRERCMSSGYDDYLLTPYTGEAFLSMLDRIIS